MMLPEKASQKFIELYEQGSDEGLSEAEIRSKAEKLIQLYCAVYGMPNGIQEVQNMV